MGQVSPSILNGVHMPFGLFHTLESLVSLLTKVALMTELKNMICTISPSNRNSLGRRAPTISVPGCEVVI